MKHKSEPLKLHLQTKKLSLIQEGGLPSSADGGGPGKQSDAPPFDRISNLHLLPKFNENANDSFFGLFEGTADSRRRPEGDQLLS